MSVAEVNVRHLMSLATVGHFTSDIDEPSVIFIMNMLHNLVRLIT